MLITALCDTDQVRENDLMSIRKLKGKNGKLLVTS